MTTTTLDFPFPPHYSFPPFFTIQPNPQTRTSQFQSWSNLIQTYCRQNKLFILSLNTETLSSPLFNNSALKRRLSSEDARTILDWMASDEGGRRIEWITDNATKKGSATRCYVYWRNPEEWGRLIYSWVEETGQKGGVLTFFELVEGDATAGQDFHGMNNEVLKKALQVLVKQGKAQIFGQEESLGVKFF